MGHFSVEIYAPPGSDLSGNLHKEEKKIDFSNLHGDSKAWKTIWGAGQSVGRTRAIQTVAEIVEELAAEDADLAGASLT